MENLANGLNSRLDTAEKRISDSVIETIQNEAQEGKRQGGKASIICGTLSSNLTYVHLESRT